MKNFYESYSLLLKRDSVFVVYRRNRTLKYLKNSFQRFSTIELTLACLPVTTTPQICVDCPSRVQQYRANITALSVLYIHCTNLNTLPRFTLRTAPGRFEIGVALQDLYGISIIAN